MRKPTYANLHILANSIAKAIQDRGMLMGRADGDLPHEWSVIPEMELTKLIEEPLKDFFGLMGGGH